VLLLHNNFLSGNLGFVNPRPAVLLKALSLNNNYFGMSRSVDWSADSPDASPTWVTYTANLATLYPPSLFKGNCFSTSAEDDFAPNNPDCASSGEFTTLLKIFSMTAGAGWSRSDGWGNASHPCTWYGVDCTASVHVITDLALGGNALSGSVPSLLAMTSLR
jgi:hypothetical protein